MANKKDYYEVLGVNKASSESDIKSAFRKLSRKYHPDMQAGKSDAEKKEAEDKFKEIAEAYEVLSDKDKRAQYDQFGFDAPHMSGGFESSDMEEILRRHAEMFGGMFGADFGFGHSFNKAAQHRTKMPENGRNVQTHVTISFKQSIAGCKHEFDMNATEACPDCHGAGTKQGTTPTECLYCHGTGMLTQRRGMMVMQSTCPYCHGAGEMSTPCPTCNGNKRVAKRKHVALSIPQGVNDMTKLRIRNGGECGLNGGADGDLFVVVHVEPSELFERNGNDVYVHQPVSIVTATLGGKVTTATPYGKIDVDIPAGTRSGQTLKFNGRGIKTATSTGDLHLLIDVETLTDLTQSQKDLLAELGKTISTKNLKNTAHHEKLMSEYYN